MATAGIREVARRAGVSPGTVSNVLNRPERVAPRTRERVQRAMRDLGFVRHGSAATLRAGHSRTVGLSVTDIGDPFLADLAAGVEEAASRLGYAVILGSSAGSPAKEERTLLTLAEQRVRGVLITPAGEDPGPLDRLRARGIGVVLLDRPACRPDQCAAMIDEVAGGRLAVAHLLDRGARRIAHVTGPRRLRRYRDRHAGAVQAVRAAGPGSGAALSVLELPEASVRAGRQAAARLLADGPPDAVFCATDQLALGLLGGLVQAGVRVPEEVALIGYGDGGSAAACPVSLSTVRRPARELGRTALRLLLEECDDPRGHVHRQVALHPELVVRESTR